MKQLAKKVGWLLGILVCLTACVDNNYTLDNLDTQIELETELVAPLLHSRLKINDLLSDSLSGMKLIVEGEDLYLLYVDSQYMGNDLIDQLKVLPKGAFNFDLLVGEEAGSLSITSGQINAEEVIEFSSINTNENERLDSILIGDCYADVTVDVQMPLAEGSYIDFIFPKEALELDEAVFPDNTVRIPLTEQQTSYQLPLKKAMLRLNGGQEVKVLVKGEIHASSPFAPGDAISVTVDMNNLLPHITYLHVGTARDIYEGEKVIDFNYTSDFQQEDAFFPFFDPQILMSCINNIGVPVRYYIDYVEAFDTRTGEKVRADFGGADTDTTSMVVATPSYDAIKGLSKDELLNFDVQSIMCKSELLFDREFGHTDRLFKINPNKLRYHYRIRSVDNDPTNVHFFFHNSDMELKEDTKLPLWFEGDKDPDKNFHITRNDSVDFLATSDTSSGFSLSDDSELVLKLSYINYLPVGVKGSIAFLDANGQRILQEAEQSFAIKAGKVDADGYVVTSTDEADAIRLAFGANEASRLLSEVATFLFTYKLANNELKTVRLRTSDWLDLKASMYINGSLVTDLGSWMNNDYVVVE